MLLSNLNLLATAPSGVARLRELILTLAVQGKLVPQDPSDEPASELLKKIRAEKDRLMAEGKIKRDKPLAEIAEEEKPFELPKGWEWLYLGDLVNSSEAGWSPTCIGSPRREGQWGVLKVSAVSWGQFDASANKELPPELAPRPDYEVKDGDFLLSRANTEELVARSVVVGKAEPKLMLSDKIIRLDVSSQVSRLFLNLCNNASHSRAHYAANASGTSSSMKNVSREVVLRTPVPLPPLAEQSHIVTRVEELMRLCDALEAKGQLEAAQHAQLVSTLLATLTESETPEQAAQSWQRVATHFDLLLDRPEAIDALEQTILQLAVRGLLVPQNPKDEPASALLKKIRTEKDQLIQQGKIKRDKPLPPIADDEKPFELPEGWEWVRLGVLTQLITSGSRDWAEHYSDSGPIFVRMGNLARGSYKLRMSHIQRVKPPRGEGLRTCLEAGDLLLSITGEVGMLGLVPADFGEAYINQHTCLIRWASDLRSEYFPIQLLSGFVQQQFNSPQRGIKNSFRLTDVSSILLALPPLAEQSRIVTRVTELRQLCARLRERLAQAQGTQQVLAQALVQSIDTSRTEIYDESQALAEH